MNYLHKAEILFWKISVRLMKNRRVFFISLTAIALVIILGLFATVSAVMSANQPGVESTESSTVKTSGAENPDLNNPEPNRDSDQHNMLILLVDSLLADKPALKGLWLVGQVEAVPQVVFLPLYPSIANVEKDEYSAQFGLDPDGRPSDTFQEYLLSKQVWWNHYIIMDETSLADLVALTDGISWDGKQVNGTEAAELLKAEADPETALEAQALIAKELCQSAQELFSNADPMILWGLLTHRMRSDLQLEMVQTAQYQYSQPGGNPICEFPTMREFTYWRGSGD